MIIDNKGRLFGKISIIDLLVILVVITAAAGVGYKFTRSKTPSPLFVKTDLIRIKYYVEEAPEFAVDTVKIGDPVKESIQNSSLGHVVDIKKDKPIFWAQNDEGQFVAASRPGYASALITMEARGIFGSNGVSINNTDYYVGRTVILYVGNAALSGRIAGLEKIE
jgi:hypothetical protein